MAAGVPGEHGLASIGAELRASFRIVEQFAKCARHLLLIARDDVVACPEKTFGVIPWCADERSSACERFKDADGRDARKLLGVVAAWDVERYRAARIHLGPAELWQVSAEVNARLLQLRERLPGVADTVHDGSQR